MAQRHIVVHDETFEQLYTIKGPRRSMEDVIKELIEHAFPSKDAGPDQESLKLDDLCPWCETELREDDQGVYCPNRGCGWSPDGGET